jgi:ankyrin repeat protein
MKQKDEFIKALEENNSDAIKVLLQTDFDPGFDDNFAICLAAEKGFKEIVALLINDTRVDPIVSYAKPLWLAAQNGHTPVVELFLFNNFNPRIYTRHHGIGFDKNNWSQRPFLWAVENGFTEIVQLFIERDLGQEDGFSPYPSSYSSLDKKNIFQEAYYLAIKSQKVAIVELLLDDDRVSPDEQEQQYNYITPLVLAVQTRNQELIKLLLDEDRIDSSKDSNAAFNKACELGYDDIVEFLLSNKVKPYYQKPEVSN